MNSTKMETHDFFFKLPMNPLHFQNEAISFLQGPDGLQGIQGPPGLPGLEVQTIKKPRILHLFNEMVWCFGLVCLYKYSTCD